MGNKENNMIIGDNVKIDPWEHKRTVAEFVHMVRTAKGPEQLLSLFMEAKRELRKEEYRVFRKLSESQFNLLLECGALLDNRI